jgi:hypothetical protein
MTLTQQDDIVCDKDGEQMQEISATDISAPAGPPMKTYSCPKCGRIKMIPRNL